MVNPKCVDYIFEPVGGHRCHWMDAECRAETQIVSGGSNRCIGKSMIFESHQYSRTIIYIIQSNMAGIYDK